MGDNLVTCEICEKASFEMQHCKMCRRKICSNCSVFGLCPRCANALPKPLLLAIKMIFEKHGINTSDSKSVDAMLENSTKHGDVFQSELGMTFSKFF